MKNKIILFLCVISLITAALAGCQKCEHTFSDKWYSDADNHWHPATCEHAETERSEFGAHTDADEDGICDVCEYEIGHTHIYEETWSNDETHHWKNATCSHADSKGDYKAHSDENMDGVCDVCSGHVHSVTAAGYCKFADCGKKVKEVDETSLDELVAAILAQKHLVNGGTIDYNFYGLSNTSSIYNANKSDLIEYTFGKDNYTHILVDTFNFNGGIDTKIPKSAANGKDPYIGANFNWWVGESDTEVKAVANAPYVGENNNWFIGTTDTKIGSAETPSIGENDNWWIGETDTGVGVIYLSNTPYVGKNGNWLIGGTEATGKFESWHQLVSPDSVFGVVSENGGALLLDLPEVDRLNGHYIAMSTFVGEYGVEETLYALYEVAVSDNTDELVVIPDSSENKITFKYNYKTVFVNTTEIAVGDNVGGKVHNVNYFEVEVIFNYNDDYVLTDLMLHVDCYTNDPGTADRYGFLYPDVDIEYDPETGEFTFVEYKRVLVDSGETDADGNPIMEYVWQAVPTDKRTPDTYVINVTQTVGERTEENPNPKTKFIPEGYSLYFDRDDDTGELSNKWDGSVISAKVRDVINFYVGDCTPAGTSLHFIADQVSFKLYKNNVEIQNLSDSLNETAIAMFTFSGEQRSFFIIPRSEGAYRFEIYLMGEKTHEITIHVGVVEEEFIELGDNEIAVKITETYSWSNEVVFTATEAGTYYFNLPAGIGFINADEYDAAEKTSATDDGPEPYFDYNVFGNENGGSFSLTLEEGETIRFYANGTKRGTVIVSYVLF